MNTKPILCGEPLIEIERKRYDELVHKEERLRLLENSILTLPCYGEREMLKTIFNIKEKEK